MKKLILWLGLSLAFITHQIQAQVTKGGQPYSIAYKLTPATATFELPAVDVQKLLDEDKQSPSGEKPLRFGYTFEVALRPGNAGDYTLLPDGGRLWRLRILAQNALSINITFSKFKLHKGAKVYLFNPVTGESIGALDEDNHQPDEKLGVGLIKGTEMVVELYEPAGTFGLSQIEIGWITHGYKNVLGYGDSGSCNMNVNCPMGAAWQDQKRSVAIIINNGDWCTGALINNTKNDGTPYFLTANHCFANSHTTWVFYFNWESPTCQNQPVPRTQSVSGSTLVARAAPSDFMLLRLNQAPPESFNVYYAGWDRRDKAPQKSVGIHHPSGDIKKISFDEDSAISQAYSGTNDDGTHWRINNWEYNTTTEGGSSGSPLFDQNKRIVGQLHGGAASCSNNSYDKYGKLWYSWDKGNTPQTRLKDWLDPDDLGPLAIDGLDASCAAMSVNLPFIENFENSPALPQRWRIRNPNNDSTWRIFNGVSAYNIGNRSLFINNTSTPPSLGNKDQVQTIPFNFFDKGNIKLVFDYAYIKRPDYNGDSLSVRYAFDCGTNGTLVWKKGGETLNTDNGSSSSMAPNAQSWRRDTIHFGDLLDRKQKVIFIFENRSGSGAPIFIDNIQILGTEVLPTPQARFGYNILSACPGGSVQFTDSSKYSPTQWQWSFPGGTPATSTEQNPVVTYSTPGTYGATLTVTNAAGSSTYTQTAIINIRNFSNAEVPVSQNFTSSNFPPAGYQIINPDGGRTWIRSNQTASGAAGSMLMDNFNYNAKGQLDFFYTPRLNLSNLAHFNLRFKYAYAYFQTAFSSGFDTLIIGYTKDCGETYTPLWKRGGVQLATVGNRTSRYANTQPADWREIVLNLDSLLPKQNVALVFISKTDYGNSLYIDDIIIDSTSLCPEKPVIQTTTTTVCVGDTLVLSTDVISGVTHQWSGPGNFAASTSTATIAITDTLQSGVYTLINSNAFCPSMPDSIRIKVVPLPPLPIITQNGGTLSINTQPNLSYQWLINGQPVAGANGSSFTPDTNDVYVSITVTNLYGCTNTTPELYFVNTALQRLAYTGIKVYPNPTTGQVHIQSNGEIRELVILNTLGQVVVKQILTGNYAEVSLATQAKGMYIIQLKDKHNQVQHIKVLKQ